MKSTQRLRHGLGILALRDRVVVVHSRYRAINGARMKGGDREAIKKGRPCDMQVHILTRSEKRERRKSIHLGLQNARRTKKCYWGNDRKSTFLRDARFARAPWLPVLAVSKYFCSLLYPSCTVSFSKPLLPVSMSLHVSPRLSMHLKEPLQRSEDCGGVHDVCSKAIMRNLPLPTQHAQIGTHLVFD